MAGSKYIKKAKEAKLQGLSRLPSQRTTYSSIPRYELVQWSLQEDENKRRK
jgi:hypothetical protein